MRIDLHTHSTASDGALEPTALCQRAAAHGVEFLSITDHDTCAGYPQLDSQFTATIRLIPGIEFSTYWRNTGIHILGLNINLRSQVLLDAIAGQQKARRLRAETIASRLERHGIENCLPDVERLARTNQIGRPHFAQHLVDIGRVKTVKEAFRKFLGPGKPGDVTATWPPMSQIVEWIHAAGGTAVLAHPAKYGLTWSKLNALLDAFSTDGGQGIEVISGPQTPELTERLAGLSVAREMLASCGSDFHAPEHKWNELGHIPDLPAACTPVWHAWDLH